MDDEGGDVREKTAEKGEDCLITVILNSRRGTSGKLDFTIAAHGVATSQRTFSNFPTAASPLTKPTC